MSERVTCDNCGGHTWQMKRKATLVQVAPILDGKVAEEFWQTLEEEVHTQHVICSFCKEIRGE